MKTPAGKECRHYYEDYNRGRDIQECRLAKENPESARWNPADCSRCPVPDILLANADPKMQLKLTIKKGFMGFGRRVEVEARSIEDGSIIEDPYIGRIDNDNPGLDIFKQALEDDD